ncbi:MAG TPA: hypothetical protein VIO64_14485 [Pseudobacteroides sp.]|uniref:hypothetical protein n=1 Tax=Pseudobacteroides sp. TaxID=1968840 RepID=UPI002F952442
MKIEGYFSNIKTANETVAKLKEAGFNKVVVDMNEHYRDDRNVETNLPGTETSVSLSGLVLESGAYGEIRDKAPLVAASPMVSGIGKFEEVADANCKVIAESNEGQEDKAKQIIRDMGGELESPNLKKPHLENDEEIAIYNSLNETRKFLDT